MNRLPTEELKAVPELEHLFPIPENAEEIREDIRQRGIQEPLVITAAKGLVCGYTRLRIAPEQAKLLGRTDPEALDGGKLARRVFTYEQRKQKREHRRAAETFFQEHPEAAPLLEAYRQGWVDIRGARVVVKDLEHELHPDRPLPKYSGQAIITLDEVASPDLSKIPLFPAEEWAQITVYDPSLEREIILEDLFPGVSFDLPSPAPRADHVRETPASRRTYDPRHGHALFQGRNGNCYSRDECFEGEWEQITAWPETSAGLIFVKRGWGRWEVAEFNDGEGHRTRRRYFHHDHIAESLIREAVDTVTPGRFSHFHYGRLSIHSRQKVQMSWAYARRDTIPAEEAIKALEADLANLKAKTKARKKAERLMEDLLDHLQGYEVPVHAAYQWREGVQTVPRRDDGTFDKEAWDSRWPKWKPGVA